MGHWGNECHLWRYEWLALARSLLFVLGVKPLLHLAVAFGALAGLVGCGVDTEGADYAEGLGTPESPIPSDESYAVVSRIDLSLDMPTVNLALANLRTFSQNPAHALLAQPAGVQLSAALPASVRDRLEAWMNTEIDKVRIGTKTIRQYATDVAAISETVIDDFTIESSLALTPSYAVHAFTNLNFTPANLDIIIPIGGLKADAINQRTTAVVGAGGALTLGEQRFSLALGNHAWHAINLASTTLYGNDLSVLASGLNCTAIADTVSTKCYAGACVGHPSELAALCTSAVAALIDDLRAQVAPINVNVMLFAHGKARLVDDGGDGIADHIVDGTWDAQVDVGQGLRAATATFVAHRH